MENGSLYLTGKLPTTAASSYSFDVFVYDKFTTGSITASNSLPLNVILSINSK